jgi:carbamoyltransferase
MYILGVHFKSHDASAALVRDGELLAACEEERFNRQKHTRALPAGAIASCLAEAGICIDQIDHVAVSFNPWLFLPAAFYNTVLGFPKSILFLRQTWKDFRKRIGARDEIGRVLGIPRKKISFVGHHTAHAAGAFFSSPFKEAAVLTIDARGEYETVCIFHARDISLKKLYSVKYPHSLGFLYTMVTEYLGFRPYSDEYKVMGLAACGSNAACGRFSDLIDSSKPLRLNLSYFNHHYTQGTIRRKYSDKFHDIFKPRRTSDTEIIPHHADMAYAVQNAAQESMLRLARLAFEKTGCRNLCLAGGLALNCTANSFVAENGPFSKIFVQPAANDAGSSLGAAFSCYIRNTGKKPFTPKNNIYLGPSFISDSASPAILEAARKYESMNITKVENPAQTASGLLHEGNVIGWFQGRMEYGPRALGARSILAKPTDAAIREIINSKIKYREEFRPFAPAVLEEFAADYFELLPQAEYLYEYMLGTVRVKRDKTGLIPAVVHADCTARVQIVKKRSNPLFWELIYGYYKLSGVPVVLNTSFNIREPIVCTVRDAIETFANSGMDYLVVDNFVISRKNQKKALRQ